MTKTADLNSIFSDTIKDLSGRRPGERQWARFRALSAEEKKAKVASLCEELEESLAEEARQEERDWARHVARMEGLGLCPIRFRHFA